MGAVKRRVTKAYEPHFVPAVILQPGWTIEFEGQQMTVVKNSRIAQGPRYLVETTHGSLELGAARKIAVISTESTSNRA